MRPVVLVAVFMANGAFAQAPASPAVTTRLGATKAAAPRVVLIKPDGAVARAAGETRFEQRTRWVQRDEHARDFLHGNGLVADERTIAAFRKLNPQVRGDGTIPAGSRVSVFAPALATDAAGESTDHKASVDIAHIAKYSVSGQVAQAQQVRSQTIALPASKYERAADIGTHRQLVSSIDKTARLVEQRADRLSAADLALSRYYLAYANTNAARVAGAANVEGVSSSNIAQLQTATAPVQRMQARLAKGDSPFDYRRIVVSVITKPGAAPLSPLRVYVLPGGIVDTPQTFDGDLVKQLLVDLTFERLTTPSASFVAQGDMRLWIGPDHEYDGMAKLVREQRPFPFTPLRAAAASGRDLVLEFNAPDDIVVP